jgi:hypothetical protein
LLLTQENRAEIILKLEKSKISCMNQSTRLNYSFTG